MSKGTRKWIDSCKNLFVVLICSHFLFNFCSAIKRTRNRNLSGDDNDIRNVSSRDPKNLFPFVWVTFQPSPCGAEAPAIKDGVCVQRGKCSKRGGMANNAMCRDGFGECCTFVDMCNGTRTTLELNQLVTTINTPTPRNLECTLRFKKEPNICQIKLDFVEFTMEKANEDGLCQTDRLTISNTKTVAQGFTTCGDLRGQHMYLTFGTQDMIEVTPVITSAMGSYKIVATRIPCDSANRAPDYCLQYFTTQTGVVKSFDWRMNGQQQSKQEYTVCVKPTSSSTEIMWKQCTGMTGGANGAQPFRIMNNPGLPDTLAGDKCISDWVQVKGKDKQCEVFVPQTSKWKPYELLVNFDSMELPTPPRVFNVEVDPNNCMAQCEVYNRLTDFECTCVAAGTGGGQACMCLQTSPDPVAGMPLIPADVDNNGFCLEYMQM